VVIVVAVAAAASVATKAFVEGVPVPPVNLRPSGPLDLHTFVTGQHTPDEIYLTLSPYRWINAESDGPIKLVKINKDGTNSAFDFNPQNRFEAFADYRRDGSDSFHYFVSSPKTFLCRKTADEDLASCATADHLDAHDFLTAANGDTIEMYYAPDYENLQFLQQPLLELVLKRFDKDHKLLWEWSTKGHFSRDDGRFQEFDGSGWAAAKQRVKSVIAHFWRGVGGSLPSYSMSPLIDTLDVAGYDYVHGNSIDFDRDGGIIVSARHLNTIFKVDYPSGKIAWRMGGIGSTKTDFRILGDPLGGFSHQHSARILSNGNLLVFDNGNLRDIKISRAVEYQLDQDARTARFLWEYRADPAHKLRPRGGSVQRLANGNTLIGWGDFDPRDTFEAPLAIATEVTPSGTKVWEISSTTKQVSYRAWAYEGEKLASGVALQAQH
jgi:Arylsulfotransferase (ASST)